MNVSHSLSIIFLSYINYNLLLQVLYGAIDIDDDDDSDDLMIVGEDVTKSNRGKTNQTIPEVVVCIRCYLSFTDY